MRTLSSCRLGLALVGLLAGCGPSENRCAVSGKVLLDGQPLADGTITFVPVEGTLSPTAGGVITQGGYLLPGARGPMAGTFRVEIRAQRKTGRKILAGSPAPQGTLVEETVEAIPPRYNRQSELRVTLKPGNNTQDFALTSP